MASICFVLALLHVLASVKAENGSACDDNIGTCESLTGTGDANALLQTKARVGEAALSLKFESATENGDAFLQSLEDIMQSVKNGTVDVSQLTIIKDMVEKLMPSVNDAHADATVLLNEAIERVNACVSETEQALTKASETAGTVTVLEDNHKTCRSEQKIKFDDNKTKCEALDRFLTDTEYPPVPNHADYPNIDLFLEALEPVLNEYSRLADELHHKKHACHNATAAYHAQKSKCDGEQATYEARFCEYRAELTILKADSSQCYADAKSSYDDISADTPGKVEKLKAQKKAFKKILCYLEVWLKSGTVDAAVAQQCEDTPIDTTELAINDPGIPDETFVNDSSVAVFPGTTGWLGKYAGLFSHNTAVVHCEAAAATEAPTTTTVEGIAFIGSSFIRQATYAPPLGAAPTWNTNGWSVPAFSNGGRNIFLSQAAYWEKSNFANEDISASGPYTGVQFRCNCKHATFGITDRRPSSNAGNHLGWMLKARPDCEADISSEFGEPVKIRKPYHGLSSVIEMKINADNKVEYWIDGANIHTSTIGVDPHKTYRFAMTWHSSDTRVEDIAYIGGEA